MQTTPKFKPANKTSDEQSAPTAARTVLGAAPAAVGRPAPSRKVRGGTAAKAAHAAIVADRKSVANTGGRRRTSTRDALVAMQYKTLADAAPAVLKRLVQGATDQADPFHEKCLELVAKRLMPLAFWESLGKQEFREDTEGANRPVFVINVGTAQLPDAPAVEIVPRERGDNEAEE